MPLNDPYQDGSFAHYMEPGGDFRSSPSDFGAFHHSSSTDARLSMPLILAAFAVLICGGFASLLL